MAKLIQVVTQLESGGAQRVALDLSDYFNGKNVTTLTVFLYCKRPVFEDREDLLVLFPKKPTGLEYLVILARLFRLIKKEKPDVVISHTHYANIITQTLSWILRTRKRIAVHHNSPKTFPRIAKYLDYFLGVKGIYTRIVTVASHVKADFKYYDGRYYKKILVIPNGTSYSKFSLQKPLDMNLPIRTISIGRLADQKNHMFLLNIVKSIPDVVLYLIGDGELKNTIKSRILDLNLEDRVILTGEIDRKSISEYMHNSIFLFPSKFEAMPLAVIEAMRAGLYIIASDIPAARELLGDTGVLLPLDESKWVHAIEKALNSPIERVRLGKKAMDRASLYTSERMGEEYAKII